MLLVIRAAPFSELVAANSVKRLSSEGQGPRSTLGFFSDKIPRSSLISKFDF